MVILMPRKLVFTGIIIVLLLPLAFFVLRLPVVSTQLSGIFPLTQSSHVTDRYSTESRVPGYSLTLASTAYLDYIAGTMGIFGRNAIIDPAVYRGGKNTARHTVSHVRFVLVPTIESPLGAAADTLVKGKPIVFLAQGDYRVEGDTLVVMVYLNTDALTKSALTRKFVWEDTFLAQAVYMLAHAKGLLDAKASTDALIDIHKGIQDNLYSGLLPWPLVIGRTQ